MKIRTLKKFLKDYKPIIEVRLPDTISIHELHNFRLELNKIVGSRYLVYVCVVPSRPIDLLASISEDKILEFKEQWLKHLQSSKNIIAVLRKDDNVEFHTMSSIIIHSPFKMPLKLYHKKLQQIKDLAVKHQ